MSQHDLEQLHFAKRCIAAQAAILLGARPAVYNRSSYHADRFLYWRQKTLEIRSSAVSRDEAAHLPLDSP